jgi:hypothetical protein
VRAPTKPSRCFPCDTAVYWKPASVNSEPDFVGYNQRFSERALLQQPDGFEGRPPIGGYRDAPDLVVLDGDDGESSQAQLEATAPPLTESGSDAHEAPLSCTDEFPWLQVEIAEGFPQILGPLQGSSVPLMPGRSWNVGIVLKFDVIVQIPKRLGTTLREVDTLDRVFSSPAFVNAGKKAEEKVITPEMEEEIRALAAQHEAKKAEEARKARPVHVKRFEV